MSAKIINGICYEPLMIDGIKGWEVCGCDETPEGKISNIVASIDNQPVIRIGSNAFQWTDDEELEKLDLSVLTPELIQIGEGAFSFNQWLKEVILPTTLKRIGLNGFSGCFNLETVQLNEGLKIIGRGAFANCGELTSVTIPTSITKIGLNTFNGCKNLRNLQLQEGLKTIGAFAFDGCKRLESVRFPSTLKTIGNYAFNGCETISNIELPTGLNKIGTKAFYKANVTEIVLPEGIKNIAILATKLI